MQMHSHLRACRNRSGSGAATWQHSRRLMAASHSPMMPSHASHGSYEVNTGMAIAKRSMKGIYTRSAYKQNEVSTVHWAAFGSPLSSRALWAVCAEHTRVVKGGNTHSVKGM